MRNRAFMIPALAGLALAGALFWFGVSYPLASRLRGDALEYMSIAAQFPNLAAALTYVGRRSIGMPFIDYLLRPPVLDQNAIAGWALSISILLFMTHVAASAAIVWWVRRRRLVRSPLLEGLLFALVVAFPGLIGYTTTPLTDTVSIDLTLLALAALDQGGRWSGVTAGALWAFAALVRPAFMLPVLVSVSAYAVISAIRDRRVLIAASAMWLALVMPMGLATKRCADEYHAFCLQDPRTFDALGSAQAGLKGGRLLWNKGDSPHGSIVPDRFMIENFHERCRLQSLVGVSASSWTGCLLTRPHLVPVFLIKRWIGLFDHFRFQPYVELTTPAWLRRTSRAFDAVAWVGFVWGLGALLRARGRVDRSVGLYLAVAGLMLAQHTLTHPEDRYGLVLAPVSLIAAAWMAEQLVALARAKQWTPLVAQLALAGVAVAVFAWQISAWDDVVY